MPLESEGCWAWFMRRVSFTWWRGGASVDAHPPQPPLVNALLTMEATYAYEHSDTILRAFLTQYPPPTLQRARLCVRHLTPPVHALPFVLDCLYHYRAHSSTTAMPTRHLALRVLLRAGEDPNAPCLLSHDRHEASTTPLSHLTQLWLTQSDRVRLVVVLTQSDPRGRVFQSHRARYEHAVAFWRAQRTALRILLHYRARSLSPRDARIGLPWRVLLALLHTPCRLTNDAHSLHQLLRRCAPRFADATDASFYYDEPPPLFEYYADACLTQVAVQGYRRICLLQFAEHLVFEHHFALWGPGVQGRAPEFAADCFAILLAIADDIDRLCRFLRLVARHTLLLRRRHDLCLLVAHTLITTERVQEAHRLRAFICAALAVTIQRISLDWRWESYCIDRLLYECGHMGVHVTVALGDEALRRVNVNPKQGIHLSTRTYAHIFQRADKAFQARSTLAMRTLAMQRRLDVLPMELQILIARLAGLGPMPPAACINAHWAIPAERARMRRYMRRRRPPADGGSDLLDVF